MKKRILLALLSFVLLFLEVTSTLYAKENYSEEPDYTSLDFTAEDTYDGGSFVAQNDEWLFFSDKNTGCFCALNKSNKSQYTLAEFPAANIVVHGNTLYFTDVSATTTTTTSLGMGYGETRYGGHLYKIDNISKIASGVSIQEIGYSESAYYNLKFDNNGFFALMSMDDETTEYVQLDESGQVTGYLSTESGEAIVNSIEIGGFLYLEIMTDNSNDEAYGGYILCIDRDNGSGKRTAIYGMNMHLVSNRIVFQSTSDFYLYAIEPGNDSAYVISFYPVYNFSVSSNVIYCKGYSSYAGVSFVITKDTWFMPFSATRFVGVNGWKNMIEVWGYRPTPPPSTPTPTEITKEPTTPTPGEDDDEDDDNQEDGNPGPGIIDKIPGVNTGGNGPEVYPPSDKNQNDKNDDLKNKQQEIRKENEKKEEKKDKEKTEEKKEKEEEKKEEKKEEKPEDKIDPNDAVKEVRDMFTWAGNLGDSFDGCTYNTTPTLQNRFVELYAPAKGNLGYKSFLGDYDGTFASYGLSESQINGIKDCICDIVKKLFQKNTIDITLKESSEDKKTAIVSVTVSKHYKDPRSDMQSIISRGDWKLGAGVKGSDDKATQMYKILMYVINNVQFEKEDKRTDTFKLTYDESEKHWRMTPDDSGNLLGMVTLENYNRSNATVGNSSNNQSNQSNQDNQNNQGNQNNQNNNGTSGEKPSMPSLPENNSKSNASEPTQPQEPVKSVNNTPRQFSRQKEKVTEPTEPALSKAWEELFNAYANGKMGELYNTEQKLKNFLNSIKASERKELIESLKYNYDQGLISDKKAYDYLMGILDPGFFKSISNLFSPLAKKWGITKEDPTMVNRAFNMIISYHEKYEPIE